MKNEKIRGLTFDEIEQLEEYGYSLLGYVPAKNDKDEIDRVKQEKGMLKAVALVFPDLSLKKKTPKEILEIFHQIFKETYGAVEEEKNSLPSGNGIQTENE